MKASRRRGVPGRSSCGGADVRSLFGVRWLALAQVVCLGCSQHNHPPATVEGTLRLDGKPLDNCLVAFFPESSQGSKGTHATGLTDRQGLFRLRRSHQHEGAALGWHRVTVQDLSVSTGVHRRDHGPVDAETKPAQAPPPVRRSRVPEKYVSLTETPLRQEIKPGHQVIDLDIH